MRHYVLSSEKELLRGEMKNWRKNSISRESQNAESLRDFWRIQFLRAKKKEREKESLIPKR